MAAVVGVCFFSSHADYERHCADHICASWDVAADTGAEKKLIDPGHYPADVAANLGSMLTPLGNPQNLYLYSLANMTVWQFLRIMAVPTAISFLMLSASVLFFKPELIKPLKESPAEPVTLTKIVPWIILFTACLLAVLHILPYGIALAAVIAGVLIMDRTLLLRADYGLLLTFIFLFIFFGNIRSIPAVSSATVRIDQRARAAGRYPAQPDHQQRARGNAPIEIYGRVSRVIDRRELWRTRDLDRVHGQRDFIQAVCRRAGGAEG